MLRLAVFALLCPALASAASPELKDDPLVKEVRELRDEVAALRRLREIDAKLNAAEMKLISERLERIERSLERLERRSGSRSEFTPSVSRSIPVGGTGTMLLDNRLAVTAWVTIDGITYSVAPLSTRSVRLAAGTVGYSLTADGMGVRPLVRTPLAAGETLTLTIF